MKRAFAFLAVFAIVLSVASSCRGKRETCPAYGKANTAKGSVVRSI